MDPAGIDPAASSLQGKRDTIYTKGPNADDSGSLNINQIKITHL